MDDSGHSLSVTPINIEMQYLSGHSRQLDLSSDSLVSDAPSSPSNLGRSIPIRGSLRMNNPYDTTRICVCDQPSADLQCSQCRTSWIAPCPYHFIVHCGGPCQRKYHIGCIPWSVAGRIVNGAETPVVVAEWDDNLVLSATGLCVGAYHPWKCISCWASIKSVSMPPSWNRSCINTRFERFGMVTPVASVQTLRRRLKVMCERVTECGPIGDLLDVQSSKPRAYPTPVAMLPHARRLHVLHGRRHETSLLCISSDMCSCCGRVEPYHDDPLYNPTPEPLLRSHFRNKMHAAWHCKCSGVCMGEQFYCASRRIHMDFFKAHHGGMTPSRYLSVDGPNATLCNACHNEKFDRDGEFILNFLLFYPINLFLHIMSV